MTELVHPLKVHGIALVVHHLGGEVGNRFSRI